VFRNLTGDESVHYADWPEAQPDAIDDDLEDEMRLAREVTSLGRSARVESRLKVRQPLSRAIVLLPHGTDLSAEVTAQVADELNVRDVETVRDLEGLLDHEAIPNFRTLGPRIGALLPEVKEALARTDGARVRQAFEAEGIYRLDVGGTVVELFSDDVEIRARSHEELALAQDGARVVALDTRLDADLVAEGVAREVVRFVNDQRKAAGLALSDRIALTLHARGPALAALRRHADDVAGEVLATALDAHEGDGPDGAPALELDGGRVAVELRRA
jgi:isoleucyl-tRNA synthetase